MNCLLKATWCLPSRLNFVKRMNCHLIDLVNLGTVTNGPQEAFLDLSLVPSGIVRREESENGHRNLRNNPTTVKAETWIFSLATNGPREAFPEISLAPPDTARWDESENGHQNVQIGHRKKKRFLHSSWYQNQLNELPCGGNSYYKKQYTWIAAKRLYS